MRVGARRGRAAELRRPVAEKKLPCGVCNRTMAPGNRSSLAVAATMSWTAAGSIGLRFVADAAVQPAEQATATTMAHIRVIVVSLLAVPTKATARMRSRSITGAPGVTGELGPQL